MPWPGLKWPRGRFGKREGPRLQRSEVRRQMSDGRWGQRDHGTTGQRDNKTRTEDRWKANAERPTPNVQWQKTRSQRSDVSRTRRLRPPAKIEKGLRDHGTTGRRDNKTRTDVRGQMESERRTPNAQWQKSRSEISQFQLSAFSFSLNPSCLPTVFWNKQHCMTQNTSQMWNDRRLARSEEHT